MHMLYCFETSQEQDSSKETKSVSQNMLGGQSIMGQTLAICLFLIICVVGCQTTDLNLFLVKSL